MHPHQIDTLISARWVLPIVPNQVLDHHSVAIHNKRIIDVLPSAAAREKFQATQHIELSNHVVMPGLVNAHTHSPLNLLRGLADDLSLMDWLQKHIWPAEQAIVNPESVADGTCLAILEMIRGGTTCFAEFYFFHDITAAVARELGFRCCIGTTIIQVPTAWAKNENDYLQKARDTLNNQDKPSKDDLIHWFVGPHSPYMVSTAGLIAANNLAEEFDLPLHIHLHESEDEIQQILTQHQKRPIAYLQEIGLLTSRLVAAHMVHVNEQDLDLYAKSGAHVAHCPKSNLKLANGIAPIHAMLEKNINVAIGTDSAASNNSLDMFAELNLAALLAKGQTKNPLAIPASTALEMATINGARAYGIDHEVGSLEKGKSADIIAIDMSHYITQPLYNPLSHLAYAVNRLQVSDVWIAGKQFLKHGEFTHFDVDRIIAQANRWVEKAHPFSS